MTTLNPEWQKGPCSATPRWRQLEDGSIEIESEGAIRGQWPSAIETWRTPIFESAARHGVPPNWVAGIMGIESGGKTALVSYAGAGGLMALMPGTAAGMMKKLGMAPRPFTDVLNDNALNIELGVAYMRDRLDAYNGQFPLAAIAYNAGSVRCGNGSLCIPPGKPGCVRQPCPPNVWGAIMDCWLQKDGSLKTSNYPRRAIEYANSALEHGFSTSTSSPLPPEPLPAQNDSGVALGSILAMVCGLGTGWWLVRRYSRHSRRS
jgi:hypothetical protein